MYQLINKEDDYHLLRKVSENYSAEELNSDLPIIHAKEIEKYLKLERRAVGISAVQLGIDRNIFGIDIKGKTTIVINPEFTPSGNLIKMSESCMSFDGMVAFTARHSKIYSKFKSVNHNYEIKDREMIYEKDNAIKFQHEFDHNLGIVDFDRYDKSINEKYPPRNLVDFRSVMCIEDPAFDKGKDYFILGINKLFFNKKQINPDEFADAYVVGFWKEK